jgi:molecular chaperone Hsp33
MPDELLRQVSLDGHLRVIATATGGLCGEAAERHRATGALAVALGRVGTAALMLAASAGKGQSDDHRLSLQLRGADGAAIEGLTADAMPGGGVRMYASLRRGLPEGGAGTWMSLAGLLGKGRVGVVRDLGLRQRYTGEAAMVSGEIDEDIEHYLMVSEQVDSAVGCDVQLGAGGLPVAGAGLLAQALPGSGPETAGVLARLRTGLRGGNLARALGDGHTDPEALIRVLLPGISFAEPDRRPVAFRCPCSRERVLGMLRLLGDHELGEMIATGQAAEITCNFCFERYEVALDELAHLRSPRPS